MTTSFEAEVIQVQAKKTGLDKVFKLVLETDNPQVLKLQDYICNTTVKIEVKE